MGIAGYWWVKSAQRSAKCARKVGRDSARWVDTGKIALKTYFPN